MFRAKLVEEYPFMADIANVLKEAEHKDKYRAILKSLQYAVREFLNHFEEDCMTFNIERAEQVLHHYDMYHAYFNKHLAARQLADQAMLLDVYLSACETLANMVIDQKHLLEDMMDFTTLKFHLLRQTFQQCLQRMVAMSVEINASIANESEHITTEELSSEEFSSEQDSNEYADSAYSENENADLRFENFSGDSADIEYEDVLEESKEGYTTEDENSEDEAQSLHALFSDSEAVEEAQIPRPVTPGFVLSPAFRATLFSPKISPKTPTNSVEVSSDFDSTPRSPGY